MASAASAALTTFLRPWYSSSLAHTAPWWIHSLLSQAVLFTVLAVPSARVVAAHSLANTAVPRHWLPPTAEYIAWPKAEGTDTRLGAEVQLLREHLLRRIALTPNLCIQKHWAGWQWQQ